MTLQDYVEKNKPLLQEFINSYLASQKNTIFYSDDIVDQLSDFVTNGKMLRGLIICLISKMYGREIDNVSLSLAAAIELNHSALLIHDDILDNDRLRRGRKTVFSQYEDEGKAAQIPNPYFYGISNAICIGDIAIFLSVKLFKNLPPELFAESVENFYQEMLQVGLAEQYEFVAGQRNENLTDEVILEIYKYKTARYTFSLPMRLGALIAGASQNEINRLDNIGEQLGIIFQMKDDEIGLLGSEETIGKPVGSDIRENKKTLIRQMVFNASDEKEKELLHQCFGNQDLTMQDIIKIQAIVKKYKIHESVQKELQERAKKIAHFISELSITDSDKKLLSEFVEYNVIRVS